MSENGPGEPTPTPYPYKDAPIFPATIGEQSTELPLHACMGLNSCKASDRYGQKGHLDLKTGLFVPNECAGQGYCSTAGYNFDDPSKSSDHTCHVQNDCRNQGGCGLYGTAEEMDNPAHNDCKALGSCATPINAERFSTNGPKKNQRKSVWARARQVFEGHWGEMRKNAPGAPEKLGPVPAPFTDTGPPYLWVSFDNQERSNMTACGASGLSGAGGCV